jgi:hypothetical protein
MTESLLDRIIPRATFYVIKAPLKIARGISPGVIVAS